MTALDYLKKHTDIHENIENVTKSPDASWLFTLSDKESEVEKK